MTIPVGLELETPRVTLRPLRESDYDELLKLAQQDIDMWAYFTLNLADPVSMKKWIESLLMEKQNNVRRPFTIIDKETDRIAGSMSMLAISQHDLRLEIGSSWLGPEFRSTGINKNSKYAMMRYSFDEWKAERVEFKTDVMNERARKGLKNIGGIEEGVLRSHMTMWNGRRRNSIFYSILKDEWPGLRKTIFTKFE